MNNPEEFLKTIQVFRAIGDALNPPSITDRIIQMAFVRNLRGLNLVTEREATTAEKALMGSETQT